MKKAKIFDNLGLKLLAIFIAILLWLVVLNVSDPVRTNTYNDIPIKVINPDAVTNLGKVYELEETTSVSIVVAAKRTILDVLDRDNFTAVVDLSRIDMETGYVPVRVESSKYNESIESIKSKTEEVQVKIEDMLRKQFFITPVVTGEPENGYVVGDVTTDENIVRISGAESVVSSIRKVTAEVSVSGLSRSINTSVDIKLFDENGNQIKDFNLNKNISTVGISAQIFETKEVPISASSFSGEPADGFGVSGSLSVDRDTITIAGKTMTLAAINVFDIPDTAVNVKDMNETADVEVELSRCLPEGIIVADEEKDGIVHVTVPIEQTQSKVLEFSKESVQITNVPEGFTASIGSELRVITIELTGVQSEVQGLLTSDVNLTIDVDAFLDKQESSTVREGTFRMPVTVTCPNTKTVKCARGYNLNITLEKSEDERNG